MKNVLCLVVDGLGAGALGCYGNTWLDTPSLDRLASESYVLDQVVTESCELASVYRSWWQNLPLLAAERSERHTLVEQLAKAHRIVHTNGLDEEVATLPLADAFDRSIVLPGDVPTEAAATIEDTHAGRFFAAAIEMLAEAESPQFCWMHWQGLLGPWDAPLEFRQRLADEEDPTPPESIDVPNLKLPEDYDPDQLLGIMQAYGGQVMLLDACLGVFLEQFQADPRAEETLLMLCSPRGFPLGEHRIVGLARDASGKLTGAPYSELVHVPWLLCLGDGRGRLDRSAAIAQPVDMAPTIFDALSIEDPGLVRCGQSQLPRGGRGEVAERDRAGMFTASHRGLRTAHWHYVEPCGESTGDDGPSDAQLYVKPDDRWEVNNVVRLCREEAEQMRHALRDCEQASTAGEAGPLMSPLPEAPPAG